MGAAQSIPVIGETVTVIDSGVKLVFAGACAAWGEILDDDEAKKAAKSFVGDAGKTWVEYSERNLIAAPVRAGVHGIAGDGKEAKRVMKKMGKSVEQVVDSTPVVGHAKGAVHYMVGDTEHGHNCMKGATRAVVVVGAGVLTGGVGGGAVLGGMAAVSGGVTYDATVTAIESKVKDEDCPYGVFKSIDDVKKSDKERDGHGVISSVINIGYTVTGDFVAGAAAARATKSAQKSLKARREKNALKERIGEKNANEVIETAKKLKNETKGMKGDKHVCTKTKDIDRGKTEFGFSRRCRRKMREADYTKRGKASGYRSKTNARKGHPDEFSREDGLLENAANESNIEINPKNSRAPRACAEHHSFNKLGTHGGKSNVRTCSVMKTDGNFVAVKRCDNCQQYGSLMGDVVTDRVAGMPVPTTELSYGSIASAGAPVVICIKCGNEHCEDEKCDNEKGK